MRDRWSGRPLFSHAGYFLPQRSVLNVVGKNELLSGKKSANGMPSVCGGGQSLIGFTWKQIARGLSDSRWKKDPDGRAGGDLSLKSVQIWAKPFDQDLAGLDRRLEAWDLFRVRQSRA